MNKHWNHYGKKEKQMIDTAPGITLKDLESIIPDLNAKIEQLEMQMKAVHGTKNTDYLNERIGQLLETINTMQKQIKAYSDIMKLMHEFICFKFPKETFLGIKDWHDAHMAKQKREAKIAEAADLLECEGYTVKKLVPKVPKKK